MYYQSNSTELPQNGDINGVTAHYGAGGGSDVDADGFQNSLDNCPVNANPDQANMDNDNYGDKCDADIDGDSFVNDIDNCPLVANTNQADLDNDDIGDACDGDADGDGVF
ncbi:MAG: thrombospondin type 3 repeat-containing protein, partial [Gammaproteobacteria bacterium]|nr:thrombospondin type 3 repeat-containing protein [Gammaproteobacteria bacterium]